MTSFRAHFFFVSLICVGVVSCAFASDPPLVDEGKEPVRASIGYRSETVLVRVNACHLCRDEVPDPERRTIHIHSNGSPVSTEYVYYVANTKTISTKKNMFDDLMSIK